jgi:hypothetical protein
MGQKRCQKFGAPGDASPATIASDGVRQAAALGDAGAMKFKEWDNR